MNPNDEWYTPLVCCGGALLPLCVAVVGLGASRPILAVVDEQKGIYIVPMQDGIVQASAQEQGDDSCAHLEMAPQKPGKSGQPSCQ